MFIRPTRSGLMILAGYFALPGLLAAAIAFGLHLPWPGLLILLLWLSADTLITMFHFGSLTVRVRDNCLIAEWGIAFPRRWVMPLGHYVALQRFTTPAMQLTDCCMVSLIGPGGRVLLWAMPSKGVRALELALREEQP